MKNIGIIIVDDHPIFRSGLRQIICDEPDMDVVAEAGNARQLYKLTDKVDWDIIILDISLPGENGLDILKQLKCRYKKIPVLFLSNHPESQYALRTYKAGASGYMTKEAVPRLLVKALRKIARGGKYISPYVAEKMAFDLEKKDHVNGPDEKDHQKLSDREFQVMCLMGKGLTPRDIADELSLSVHTVSTYRTRILEKMELKSSAEIIQYAVKNNLIA